MKLRPALLTFAACAFFATAPAYAASPVFEYSQAGDLDLDCHQISREISAMELLISQAKDIQDTTHMTTTGVTVAKTVGSYLVGTMAGGIGILAAGYLVNEAADDKAEDALALEDAAEQRRSFMAGIYNARGCNGPLDLAAIAPASGDEKATNYTSPRKRRYND